MATLVIALIKKGEKKMDAKKKQTILTIVLVIVLGIYTLELISLGIEWRKKDRWRYSR